MTLCLTACAARQDRGRLPDRCALGDRSWREALPRIRDEARRWLRLAPLRSERMYDAAPVKEIRRLRFAPGSHPRAVISFADAEPGDPVRNRSFLYDDALALLWLTAAGDENQARDLAAALVALQNDDGTWGFSVSVEEGFYNAGYVRMGTVAWVTHALAHYARRFVDPPAGAAAERGGRALLAARRADAPAGAGLVEGGRGRYSQDERSFFPDFRLRAAITEHQFDAQMALATVATEDGERLADRILSTSWLPGEGRFAVAVDDAGPDPARALDAAGGWGALWLLSRHEVERARRSLAYTVEAFAAHGADVAGFRPYLDPVDGPLSALEPDLVFVEGTLGVGLAAHRLGQRALAEQALETAVRLACRFGPGVPYANRPARGFPARPAVAPTVWFLFLDQELGGGAPAPIFLPTPPPPVAGAAR
jgi:hypothetical protein